MPRAEGLLSGPVDHLTTPSSPSTQGTGAALRIEPASPLTPRGATSSSTPKTWATSLREYSSFVLIGAAYSTLMYMTWKKNNHDGEKGQTGSEWEDYPGSWALIGVFGAAFAGSVAWQCKLDECRLGSKDGSRKIKLSRISGWFWCVVIMLILLSIPPVLYFFGEVQLCDADSEKMCIAKNRDCAWDGGKCKVGDSSRSRKSEPQAIGKILSTVFAVLSIFLGVREIVGHWRNYHSPPLQKQVVRILAMVPIYAMCSWLTLIACSGRLHSLPARCVNPQSDSPQNDGSGSGGGHGAGIFGESLNTAPADDEDHNCYEGHIGFANLCLAVVRELYEAYTLYSFFTFLTLALGKVAETKEQRERERQIAVQQAAQEALEAGQSEEERQARQQEEVAQEQELQRRAAIRNRQQQQLENQQANNPRGEEDEEAAAEIAATKQAVEAKRQRDQAKQAVLLAQGVQEDTLQLIYRMLVDLGEQQHSWSMGMGWLKPWQPGKIWLNNCRVGVMQYVFFGIFILPIILIARLFDFYGEMTPMNPAVLFPYSTFLKSLSQAYALYCLVHFYVATKGTLAEYKPLRKFLSVKLIVFATFWQSVAIAAFQYWDKTNNSRVMNLLDLECNFGLPRQSFGAGVQATLICAEMFAASLLHRQIFSYREFRPPRKINSEDGRKMLRARPEMGFIEAMRDTFTWQDVFLAMKQMKESLTHKLDQEADNVKDSAMRGADELCTDMCGLLQAPVRACQDYCERRRQPTVDESTPDRWRLSSTVDNNFSAGNIGGLE